MALFKRKKKEEEKPKADAAPKAKAADKKIEKKAAPKAKAPKKASKTVTGDAYRVLIRPIVTEKSARLEKEGKYVFEVAKDANKIQIKRAVRDVYGTDPVDVTVQRIPGKRVRTIHGFGRRKDWRKAVVTLKEGQSIEVFSSNV